MTFDCRCSLCLFPHGAMGCSAVCIMIFSGHTNFLMDISINHSVLLQYANLKAPIDDRVSGHITLVS